MEPSRLRNASCESGTFAEDVVETREMRFLVKGLGRVQLVKIVRNGIFVTHSLEECPEKAPDGLNSETKAEDAEHFSAVSVVMLLRSCIRTCMEKKPNGEGGRRTSVTRSLLK